MCDAGSEDDSPVPMSKGFQDRLEPILEAVADHFDTPFYLYDAAGIDQTCRQFNATFSDMPVREYFAVKALPNPAVLRRLVGHGFGFDCSSPPELALAHRAGADTADVIYTSNNAGLAELTAALTAGALVTVDDETVLDTLMRAGLVPERLAFRVNPGAAAPQFDRTFFGAAQRAKFGIPVDRLTEVCLRAAGAGVRSFGLHMMVSANALDGRLAQFTLDFLAEQAIALGRVGIEVHWLDVGGGLGVPFRPEESHLDLGGLAARYRESMASWPDHLRPEVCFENGSYITAPHGVLVTRVVNRMSKWRELVGVDVSTNALMRPVIYADAYHHITAPFADSGRVETVDVVGGLCTNLDRFATGRALPAVQSGDLLIIHDAGAHGYAMGHTYNGRLRPKELLMHDDGSVELIRRAERADDYFATLAFASQSLGPALLR